MTLLEVLVALVIFSLAGLALMDSMLTASINMQRLRERNEALWLADNFSVNEKAGVRTDADQSTHEVRMGNNRYLLKSTPQPDEKNNEKMTVVDIYDLSEPPQLILHREYRNGNKSHG